MRHALHSELLNRKVRVCLVGCGGNGSQMLSGLVRLHLAMLSLGHPAGLEVTAYDPDTVSVSNVGRQLFYQADVGLHKCIVLVNRINTCFGLDWKAVPRAFSDGENHNFDLYISCTDSRESRRMLHNYFAKRSVGYQGSIPYWLDLGNMLDFGQVCLGEPQMSNVYPRIGRHKFPERLPTITELYPDLLDPNIKDPEDVPTCSLAAALSKQDLFICQNVSALALNLLFRLFSKGGIDFSAQFINLASGRTNPLPVDLEAWKRFGVGAKKTPKKKKVAA